MQAIPISSLIMLLSFNLSPAGAGGPRQGDFWRYVGSEATIRIVEVTLTDTGTSLRVHLSQAGQTVRLAVVLAPDGKSLSAWGNVPSARDPGLKVLVPEWKPGSRWGLAEARFLVKEVEHEPVSTPGGKFPGAFKALLVAEDGSETTVWIAPGVGAVRAVSEGETPVELVDYGLGAPAAMAQPPMRPPVVPGTGSGALAPTVAALDQNTFVVADPVTQTVTVFLLVRRESDDWTLIRKAVEAYGPLSEVGSLPSEPCRPTLLGSAYSQPVEEKKGTTGKPIETEAPVRLEEPREPGRTSPD